MCSLNGGKKIDLPRFLVNNTLWLVRPYFRTMNGEHSSLYAWLLVGVVVVGVGLFIWRNSRTR